MAAADERNHVHSSKQGRLSHIKKLSRGINVLVNVATWTKLQKDTSKRGGKDSFQPLKSRFLFWV